MDKLKEFLELDKERTQGKWRLEYSESNGDDLISIDGETRHITLAMHEIHEDIVNSNFISIASEIAPVLRQMVADMKVMREGLKGLHADTLEYLSINNLGGKNNHWMVYARQSLAQTEKYLPLFESAKLPLMIGDSMGGHSPTEDFTGDLNRTFGLYEQTIIKRKPHDR